MLAYCHGGQHITKHFAITSGSPSPSSQRSRMRCASCGREECYDRISTGGLWNDSQVFKKKKKSLTKTSLLKITPDSRGCILIWESFSANRASSRRTILFISFFLPLFQTRYCLLCRHPQPPPKFYLFDGCDVVLNRRIRGSP